MVVLGPRRLGDVGSRLFCLYPFFFFFFWTTMYLFRLTCHCFTLQKVPFFMYLVLPLTHLLNMYCFFFFFDLHFFFLAFTH